MKRFAVICALLGALAVPAGAEAAGLRAGVGKADITPQTGYYLGGWTRADRVAGGQHTRLFSRAMVLERDGRKVALVQLDLFMVPGGMVQHIGEALAARGFSERNILISASHTHSGPGGYANFPTLNTAAPSLQTATDPLSFFRFFSPNPADRQLYTFLVRQITAAIRRADDDLGAAEAGWGSSRILGLTRNRSLEAHLANHGKELGYGQGKESDDPGGYEHTIDPAVNVLRVDKIVRRRVGRGKRRRTKRVRVPMGGWSTFADHGTVTKSTLPVLQRRPPRLRDAGVRGARAQARQGAAAPGGAERLRQQQRGRHVGGAGPQRPRRVGLRRARGGRRDGARVARGAPSSSRARPRWTCAGRGSASAARTSTAGPWPASRRWACRS